MTKKGPYPSLESLTFLNPAFELGGQFLSQQMLEVYRRRELGLSRGERRHRWSRFGFDALGRRRRSP